MIVQSSDSVLRSWLARSALALTLSFSCAEAEAKDSSRVALVIGNSAYETVSPLPNTTRDSDAVRRVLEEAKFEVVYAENASHAGMRTNLETFSSKAASAHEVVVYFAGHGVQMSGSNYLMPVDLKVSDGADIVEQGLSLEQILKRLDATPAKVKVVILDACRNNPFLKSQNARGLAATLLDDPAQGPGKDRSTGSETGLARVSAKGGTFVAFSTSPGATAADGGDAHSPYTEAFLKFVREPGLPIEQLFRQVRSTVDDTTAGTQLPWETSSLTTAFSFFGAVGREAPAKDAAGNLGGLAGKIRPTYVSLREEDPREAYRAAIRWNDPVIYRQFLEAHPDDERALRIQRIIADRQEEIAWATLVRAGTREDLRLFLTLYPNSAHAFEARTLFGTAESRRIDRVAALCPNPQRSLAPIVPLQRTRSQKAERAPARTASKPIRPVSLDTRRPPSAVDTVVRRPAPVDIVDDDDDDGIAVLLPRGPVVLGLFPRGPRPWPGRPYPGDDGRGGRYPNDQPGRRAEGSSPTGPSGGVILSRGTPTRGDAAGPMGGYGRGGFGGYGGRSGGFGRR